MKGIEGRTIEWFQLLREVKESRGLMKGWEENCEKKRKNWVMKGK
jgi:hypothetical protein